MYDQDNNLIVGGVDEVKAKAASYVLNIGKLFHRFPGCVVWVSPAIIMDDRYDYVQILNREVKSFLCGTSVRFLDYRIALPSHPKRAFWNNLKHLRVLAPKISF